MRGTRTPPGLGKTGQERARLDLQRLLESLTRARRDLVDRKAFGEVAHLHHEHDPTQALRHQTGLEHRLLAVPDLRDTQEAANVAERGFELTGHEAGQ